MGNDLNGMTAILKPESTNPNTNSTQTVSPVLAPLEGGKTAYNAHNNDEKLKVAENDIQSKLLPVIRNNDGYEFMAELGKKVKTQISVVVDTFKDMKEQAHKAHKTICEKEKSFLKPLSDLETTIKERMNIYLMELEIEREKQIKESQALIEDMASDLTQEEQDLLQNIVPVIATAHAQGVSSQDDFEIEITNPLVVPSYIAGIEVRQINTSAIKKYAKMCNGNCQIPGIKIIRKKRISIKKEV